MAKKIKTKAVAVAGDEELGRVAYEAYAKTRDWKSVEGTPLPDLEKAGEAGEYAKLHKAEIVKAES